MSKILEWQVDGPELQWLYEAMQKRIDRNPVFVIDEMRWHKVQKSIAQIVTFVKECDPDAEAEVESFIEFGENCGLRIAMSSIEVMNIPEFFEIIKNADNFEIHPRTDDRIGLTFSFNGVAHELIDLTARSSQINMNNRI